MPNYDLIYTISQDVEDWPVETVRTPREARELASALKIAVKEYVKDQDIHAAVVITSQDGRKGPSDHVGDEELIEAINDFVEEITDGLVNGSVSNQDAPNQ